MYIIKSVEVYGPEYLGLKDVFIVNDKIAMIEDRIDFPQAEIIDGRDSFLLPGFIDNHIHITGGGGEGGFKSQVPAVEVSELIKAGLTTVVGLLGTDSLTRSLENLYAKSASLEEEAITSYIYTGAYDYPSPNISGSVRKDLVFLDRVLGCKIALSDHRSSELSLDELKRLASDVRVAGMIAGKKTGLIAHMGDGDEGLSLVREVLDQSNIPISIIRPTHVNRKEELLLEAFDYVREGGSIDLTAGIGGKNTPARSIVRAREAGLDLEKISVSSDGYGSWSDYDEEGKLVRMGAARVDSSYDEFEKLVKEYGYSIDQALIYFTSNVAKILGIYPKKGSISPASDADLIMVDRELNKKMVMAKGKPVLYGDFLKKGVYEE